MLSLRNLDQVSLAPVHGGHLARRLRHPGSARLGRDYRVHREPDGWLPSGQWACPASVSQRLLLTGIGSFLKVSPASVPTNQKEAGAY